MAPLNNITLIATGRGVCARQRRPDLNTLLIGMPAEYAARLIPSLLPVCGRAQAIAAARAVEQALGITEDPAIRQHRESELLHEQAQAAAWRLLVDWPRLLGEAPDLALLKRLRGLRGDDLADAVARLVPAITADVDLNDAMTRLSNDPGIPGRVLAAAMQASHSSESTSRTLKCLDASVLRTLAESCFDCATTPGQTLRELAPGTATTVGPLAMARHMSSLELQQCQNHSPVTRLLLAILLDTQAIAERLATLRTPASGAMAEAPTADLTAGQRPAPSHAGRQGTGESFTVRGPLYHHVSLREDQAIADWQYLAPTDWHFAPGGLVEQLSPGLSAEDLRLLINAADPCAPWTLVNTHNDPLRDAA